ncbi:MAG: carbohydrate kinase family protein [Syntrophobacteraceae bacterium]
MTGSEFLDRDPIELQERIRHYCGNHPGCHLSIGGSAYLAIKSIKSLRFAISAGFVGVAGNPQQLEKISGWDAGLDLELDYLKSQPWVFTSSGQPGRALVALHKGKRQWIEISSGANEELWERISGRESEGKDFTDYLASARWVHLTSLRDFNQFLHFCERLAQAKLRNPNLKVSIDPGYEYTFKHAHDLLRTLKVADFVFLNQSEFRNLSKEKTFPIRPDLQRLPGPLSAGSQTLVVKNECYNELLQAHSDGFVSNRYHHRKVSQPIDDTGAGDIFAGGFIAGMLSPRFNGQLSASVLLGARLAATKLKSKGFPYDAFHDIAAQLGSVPATV